mmetsp:Transcript_14191/g.25391  ORF Transcript_14191/g.25391 Transcript_14191/m.25391 type:complete len:158 (-) Transcript_14191:212-685(-)
MGVVHSLLDRFRTSEDSRMSTQRFLRSSLRFAVVGASADRQKYGNRVLRAYLQHNLTAVPVHPKLEEVEGVRVQQLSELDNPEEWGVSIITPPKASLGVVQNAYELGFRRFWLQPGAESKEVLEEASKLEGIELIAGGPCVLVSLARGEHEPASTKL